VTEVDGRRAWSGGLWCGVVRAVCGSVAFSQPLGYRGREPLAALGVALLVLGRAAPAGPPLILFASSDRRCSRVLTAPRVHGGAWMFAGNDRTPGARLGICRLGGRLLPSPGLRWGSVWLAPEQVVGSLVRVDLEEEVEHALIGGPGG
jgi:hypothetical protein